jgi:serine/threonine-protein kinase RsbT
MPRRTTITQPQVAEIRSDGDIIIARGHGRALAAALGFSPAERVHVTTAISELGTNIVRYARRGMIAVRVAHKARGRGITVVASDQGPGMKDPGAALKDGYSTSGGLGLGLPGVRRLMDEFHIESQVDAGTTVTVTKWLTPPRVFERGSE